MITLLTPVEILEISTIPHINPLVHILSSMRMNQIDHHLYSHSVSSINHLFELIWSPKSGRHTKETGTMIPK